MQTIGPGRRSLFEQRPNHLPSISSLAVVLTNFDSASFRFLNTISKCWTTDVFLVHRQCKPHCFLRQFQQVPGFKGQLLWWQNRFYSTSKRCHRRTWRSRRAKRNPRHWICEPSKSHYSLLLYYYYIIILYYSINVNHFRFMKLHRKSFLRRNLLGRVRFNVGFRGGDIRTGKCSCCSTPLMMRWAWRTIEMLAETQKKVE